MQLGMIGLGRMGANMVRRLLRGGHQCVVYDHKQSSIQELANGGAVAASSVSDLCEATARGLLAVIVLAIDT